MSERSNAFVYLKERTTKELKARMIEEVRESDAVPVGAAGQGADSAIYERELCGAIFERMFAWTRAHAVPLVVLSIPFPDEDDPARLVDKFPSAEFDLHRPGIGFVPAAEVLSGAGAGELLYWRHSHSHWTPLAHRLAGEALAKAIAEGHLLR